MPEINNEPIAILKWTELADLQPTHVLIENVDLVVIRDENEVFALYGRCAHRGALLADGHIDGQNIICGVHDWDFQFRTGVSEYNNEERLAKFKCWVDAGQNSVFVDAAEIREWEKKHPQPYRRDEYLGQYADPTGAAADEPHNQHIQRLAREGLSVLGHHGPVSAMGVPLAQLPQWDDIQIVTAQLARFPRLDHEPVGTEVVIGPNAQKPLQLAIPIFVSDMSFGALSEEAKIAMARGAELAGTGICSGEGGMLPEEHAECSRYFYELASSRFGWSIDKVRDVQAFHFKAGQGAKTGTGGHLPGEKVQGRIAEVRGLKPGTPAISPSRFPDFKGVDDYRRIATEVRDASGGIPIGIKMRRSILKTTLISPWNAGLITSSSTVVEAERVRLQIFSRTTFLFQPSRHSLELVDTWTIDRQRA
jgi:nitrite reductase/ring-hydroxylating ferredoxin subunit